ncbi:Tail-specific protease [Chlamydiales bacterium STE3]|nr:Tail-specific protease [Chlamydiales bacterium STE3]
MIKFFCQSLLCFCFIICSLHGDQAELLKTKDINSIMQEVFRQHVDQKEISSSIIRNSLKNYIDQFDPERIYLLEEEVRPFTHPSQERLEAIEKDYKEGVFTSYYELNTLFQQAISRARSYRSLIKLDNSKLLVEAKKSRSRLPMDGSFAKSEQQLKMRIREHTLEFLHNEMRRYGAKNIEQNLSQAVAVYEMSARSFEEGYNYRNLNGELLPEAQQENLFSLHVLKSLARSLDAHTTIYNPEEAYDMKVRLEKGFEGIGIAFQKSGDKVFVGSLLKSSPAARSGLVQIKDEVLQINGIPLTNLTFDQVLEEVRGGQKDTITLILNRKNKDGSESEQHTVTLKRELISVEDDRLDVSYENFGSGIIGKITLHSFYQNDQGVSSEKDIREAVQQLDKEGNLRGLILDLRENSGGFLSQAVKVAGLFITSGVVVISKYANGEEKLYRDIDGKTIFDGPLIVLTSRATASAAEIVAQTLQDYGVALVVGDDRTYGKGTIQSQTVTDNQNAASYFKVTVGKYYTASGKTPQMNGVKSDIVVPGPFAKAHIGEEYLEYALKKEDKIPAVFADKLIDVDTDLKAWYLKYYMPSLQHRQRIWRELVPVLSKNSEWRIAHNKDYQLFFKRLEGVDLQNSTDSDEEDVLKGEKNFGAGDLQMAESVSILKDMIYLQTKVRNNEYMVGSEEPLKKLAH